MNQKQIVDLIDEPLADLPQQGISSKSPGLEPPVNPKLLNTEGPAVLPENFQGHAPLVGSWVVTGFRDGKPAFINLSTFTADGGVLNSDADPLANPGNGVWVALGTSGPLGQPKTPVQKAGALFGVRFIVLRARVQVQPDGTLKRTFRGKAVINAQLLVEASGKTSLIENPFDKFSGPFTTTLFDANDKFIGEFRGTVQGERIQFLAIAGVDR